MSDKVVPFVQVADSPPNGCAVYPQLDHNHPKGYLLLARHEFPTPFGGDPYAHDTYLSVEAAQQICRDHAEALNVVSKDDYTLALAENDALKARLAEMEIENNRLEAEAGAIHTLRNRYSAQRKPGRKPQPQPKAA